MKRVIKMKLTKRQLKRIIREEKQKLQESGSYIPYGQEGYDPAAEDAGNESENRKAFQQLEWSLQTLCDQLGHWGATERVVEALMSCDGGPSADEIAEIVHQLR